MGTDIIQEIDFLIEDFNKLSMHTKALNALKTIDHLSSIDDLITSIFNSQHTIANALGLPGSIFTEVDRLQIINPSLINALRENGYETQVNMLQEISAKTKKNLGHKLGSMILPKTLKNMFSI